MNAVNAGFYDLPGRVRAEAMADAAKRAGAGDFWDLTPQQRAAAYDAAVDAYWGRRRVTA